MRCCFLAHHSGGGHSECGRLLALVRLLLPLVFELVWFANKLMILNLIMITPIVTLVELIYNQLIWTVVSVPIKVGLRQLAAGLFHPVYIGSLFGFQFDATLKRPLELLTLCFLTLLRYINALYIALY